MRVPKFGSMRRKMAREVAGCWYSRRNVIGGRFYSGVNSISTHSQVTSCSRSLGGRAAPPRKPTDLQVAESAEGVSCVCVCARALPVSEWELHGGETYPRMFPPDIVGVCEL